MRQPRPPGGRPDGPNPLAIVTLAVAFPADVLHRYYPNGRLGGLAVEGRPPGQLGQLVELYVQVERPRREFRLRGQLGWARYKGSGALKESFGVDLVGDEEAVARLLAFARANLDAEATRAEPRMLVAYPVRLLVGAQKRKELAADLSTGGAFVRSGEPLEVGETLTLQLRAPGNLMATSFKARVRWTRNTGDAPGMGLEFTDDDAHARMEKVLATLLRRGQ